MGRLADKVAIVTGAGQGLGESVALRFAAEGARVAVVDVNPETAAETVERIREAGGEAILIVADCSEEQDTERMAETTLEQFGRIDILVNNAAVFGKVAPVYEIDTEVWDRIMRVNLRGPFLCSKAVIPQMKRQGAGSIVCVSSVSGVQGNENQADYNTSKHGLIGLTRCIAQDCGLDGIRANAVCPTGMNTPMMANTPAENVAPYAGQTLMSRFAEPSEVANAILFLASDEASYITGAVLMVDAGMTAIQPSGRQMEVGQARFLARAANR
ncbi:MAG: SDR family NAD(P)-dependent oxidoreductase [Candidatus Aminicenantes bacterium]|nr:SDR family NAD(P)-dependent oxidoreductase [Candidatus Aminicenantes bacterium]